MVIKNRKMIAIICLLTGFALASWAGYGLHNYFSIILSCEKTKGIITGYKRGSGTSGKHFRFKYSPNGADSIEVTSTIATFNLISRIVPFATVEIVNIAYNKQNPQDAVIDSWRQWRNDVIVLVMGLLATLIGWQMIKGKYVPNYKKIDDK